MDKYFMWIHYERLHNHNKAKHNKTVCIFLGIYCIKHKFFPADLLCPVHMSTPEHRLTKGSPPPENGISCFDRFITGQYTKVNVLIQISWLKYILHGHGRLGTRHETVPLPEDKMGNTILLIKIPDMGPSESHINITIYIVDDEDQWSPDLRHHHRQAFPHRSTSHSCGVQMPAHCGASCYWRWSSQCRTDPHQPTSDHHLNPCGTPL